jgi:hypothetical protein
MLKEGLLKIRGYSDILAKDTEDLLSEFNNSTKRASLLGTVNFDSY